MRCIFHCLLVYSSTLLLGGCSFSPSRLHPPSIDPAAAKNAISKLDSNADSALDEKELAGSPALKSALKRIDANGNRKIEAEEIDARITAWRDSKVGLLPMTIRLNSNGSPLEGIGVTLVPEEFLGAAIKPAHGVTDRNGVAVMEISREPNERGVQSGFYRVTLSKQSDGKETIPNRYNSETQLGVEIEPISQDSRDASFSLKL